MAGNTKLQVQNPHSSALSLVGHHHAWQHQAAGREPTVLPWSGLDSTMAGNTKLQVGKVVHHWLTTRADAPGLCSGTSSQPCVWLSPMPEPV